MQSSSIPRDPRQPREQPGASPEVGSPTPTAEAASGACAQSTNELPNAATLPEANGNKASTCVDPEKICGSAWKGNNQRGQRAAFLA